VTADATSSRRLRAQDEALRALAVSAAGNIPGVDFASITVQGDQQSSLRTIAATDPLAEQADALQYELREGPCYAAVTHERLVLVNDMAAAPAYPTYGPRAARLGVRSQAAVQLINHEHQTASLNLYSRHPAAFDPSTILWAELFGTQLAALLDYVEQVEQLNEALHSRTDIGTAIGILMERYGIDRNRAFAFLVRNSKDRNIKVRVLAQHIIDGTFQSTADEDARSHQWP
jgi:GAF domain-containing protein